jgi:hypothetical protein
MKIEANSPEEYINNVPDDRKEPMAKLRQIILENLPVGFEETMSYGMIGYVVPHRIFPSGYLCPLLTSLLKKTLSLFIIWEFMPCQLY